MDLADRDSLLDAPAQTGAAGGRKRHLLVAGTGRAGTSALVRYLTGLGLETHLSRRGGAALWDEAAEAGLEDVPLSAVGPDLPYVIKSPWSFQLAQEMLDDPGIALDAVIVPVRDLVEAAASRSIRELQAVHQGTPWMAEVATTWEQWGTTPGGVVYSLSPVDVARLLAVGFHRLIERLVQADVPVVLLAFPRFATDPDYLHRKLAPVLPSEIPAARAQAVHEATFSAAKVRVGHEIDASDGPVEGGFSGPGLGVLEKAALRRELARLREHLGAAVAGRDALARERDGATQERDALAGERRALAEECCALRGRLERAAGHAEEEAARREAAERERAGAEDRLARERAERARLAEEILRLRASRSWRITRPLRVLGRMARVMG